MLEQRLAEVLLEAGADVVELGEQEAAVLAQIRHDDQALAGLAFAHRGAVVALLHRRVEQRAVGAEGPGVVRAAEELAGVAAGLRHQPRALVRAAVHQHLDAAVRLAHDDQRPAADLHRQVVTGLRNLAAVADVVPGVGEEVLLLQAEDLLAEVQVAVHAVGLHQRLDLRLQVLGGAGVAVHRMLLLKCGGGCQRRAECLALVVGQRRVAQAAQRLGRVGPAGQPAGGGHQLLEVARAALVSVAVAGDQALAARDLQRQRGLRRQRGLDLRQPGLDARVLGLVAQAAAAPAAQAGQRVEHQVAAQRAGLHDAALAG